jgi:hypothetical protein
MAATTFSRPRRLISQTFTKQSPLLLLACFFVFAPIEAHAQFSCTPSATGPVCSNSGTVSVSSGNGSIINGFQITGDGTINNSGTVTASAGIGSIVSGLKITGNGTIQNQGSVTATAGNGSIVSGLEIDGNGTIQSPGTVTAAAGSGSIVTGIQLSTGTVTANNVVASAGSGSIVSGIQLGTGSVTATNVSASAGDGSIVSAISAGTATVKVTGNLVASAGTGSIVETVRLGQGSIINSGSITASAGAGSIITAVTLSGTNSSLINAGAISAFGPGATAISLTGNFATLTLDPGSLIIGAINLSGANDTINVFAGNQNLTFNTLAGVNVNGTVPFVVSGNRIVSIDPTPFAAAGTGINDFARSVSAIIPDSRGFAGLGGGVTAFAGPDGASPIDDAFASLMGVSAYSGDKIFFKNPTVAYADGFTVWGRAFGGRHSEASDGVLLRNVSTWYGGAIGVDRSFRADLRLGAFVGGGSTRNSVDFNLGGVADTTIGFGGAYANYTFGASFLKAAIQAGTLRTTTSRLVNNNLLANGLESATAAYNGWYVSPELIAGHRLALGKFGDSQYALTPSLQVRYLYASFDGYTEVGTTNAPLTVGDRHSEFVEERAELKLTRITPTSANSQIMFSLAGGPVAVQRVGGNPITGTLLALPIAFNAPGADNVWGGFAGLGMEWQLNNVSVFAAGEYLAWHNAGNIVSGRGGIRVRF